MKLNRIRLSGLAVLALMGGLLAPVVVAPSAQAASYAFQIRTTADGLGSDFVTAVFALDNIAGDDTVYAATGAGLSISTNGGTNFINRTTSDGLVSLDVRGVYAAGSKVYAATFTGLSISTNGGTSFDDSATTADGLGSNEVRGVHAIDDTVYAATQPAGAPRVGGGLSISLDGGATFVNRTRASSGLASDYVNGVYAVGSKVYAATRPGLDFPMPPGGLSISSNGGISFDDSANTANGRLVSNEVNAVYAIDDTVYAATDAGLSISTDGGATFVNRTRASSGLGSDEVNGVFAIDDTVYAATAGGVSISTDGGATFTNITGGLGFPDVNGVYAVGSTVYAATDAGLSVGVPGAEVFRVTFSANGGTGSMSSQSSSTAAALTSNAFTRSGFTFTGWNTSRNGTGTPYANGATFPFTANQTLWAQWTPNSDPPAPVVFPPSAPTSAEATAGDGEVTVSWQAPASQGSFPVTNYQVQSSPGGQSCLVPVTSTSCRIAGLTNGTAYTFQVRALNGGGWGPWATTGAVTPGPRPGPDASIVITGSRSANDRVARVRGETTELTGATLQSMWRLSDRVEFTSGSTRVVGADGRFAWQRRVGPKATLEVYFTSGDVASNTVTIAGLR